MGPEATKEQVRQLDHELGLDQPILIQLGNWLLKAVHGDFGISILLNQPVTQAIKERIGITITLAFSGLFFAILIGLPIGILAAVKHNTFTDKVGILISLFGISTPDFWLGLNLIWLLGVEFRILPVAGYVPLTQNFLEGVKHLILPAFCIGFPQSAIIARMTRSSMLEVLGHDYIRTAESKGLTKWIIVMKHALKNSLLPVITVTGMTFGFLLGGTVILENVFNISGLGRLFVNAVIKRDYPVVQAGILFIGSMYVIANLLVDILYSYLDPRIRNN